jgi:hypothetical protein
MPRLRLRSIKCIDQQETFTDELYVTFNGTKRALPNMTKGQTKTRRWAMPLSVFLVTMALSTRAEAAERDAQPQPAPPTPVSHSAGLHRATTGGILILAVTYGLALGIPVRDGFSDGREWLAVPLVGPFGGLARRVRPHWGLALDGIGQLLGTSLIAAGASVGWQSTASTRASGTAKVTTVHFQGSF